MKKTMKLNLVDIRITDDSVHVVTYHLFINTKTIIHFVNINIIEL